MKITKMVKSSNDCNTVSSCSSNSGRDEAIHSIKAAIDCLSQFPNDQVCRDSIANLSVVLVDLTPCDNLKNCDDIVPGVDASPMV